MSGTRGFDLIAFDMDGVLVDYTSSWTWVHDHFKVDNENSLVDYIEGRIDDREFMRRDIDLWLQKKNDLCREDIERILSPVPIVAGVRETISCLKENGIKTVIVSGGLDIVAEKIASQFGFDDFIANGLECDSSGRLTGEGVLRVELVNKRRALDRFLEKYQVKGERAAAIGNSFVDASMFEGCGLSIAFNPIDSYVEEQADHVINSKDLRTILPLILDSQRSR